MLWFGLIVEGSGVYVISQSTLDLLVVTIKGWFEMQSCRFHFVLSEICLVVFTILLFN